MVSFAALASANLKAPVNFSRDSECISIRQEKMRCCECRRKLFAISNFLSIVRTNTSSVFNAFVRFPRVYVIVCVLFTFYCLRIRLFIFLDFVLHSVVMSFMMLCRIRTIEVHFVDALSCGCQAFECEREQKPLQLQRKPVS